MKKWSVKWLPMLLLLFTFLLAGNITDVKALATTTDGTGVPNLSYTFTSTKEEEISTEGDDGQTTVLVFGATTCSNSQSTIRNIAGGGLASRTDVRVIFAEGNAASCEEVKAFARTYGNDAITFCYNIAEASYMNNIMEAMWEYHDLFYESNSNATLPFTVLIDANNQVRKVFSGNCTSRAIEDEIEKFTAAGNEKPGESEKTEEIVNVSVKGTENYEYVKQILSLVNQERSKAGVSELKLDEELLETAMQRAAEISMYYSHTRPDGSTCFTASARGTKKAENIAVGYQTPQAVMSAWMSSDGHRSNIMDSEVTSIGIGCFQDSQGIWNWVQFFDNAAATEPTISGSKQVVRMVSVRNSLLKQQEETDQEKQDSEPQPDQKDTGIAKISGLKASSGTKSVKLTWKKVSGAEGYFIYQYNSAKKNWKQIATVKSEKVSYTVKNLKTGTAYRFAVKAYKVQNKKQTLSQSYTSIYTATKPATVKFKVTAGKKKATLKWSKVKGATGYRVYYKTSAKSTFKKLKSMKGIRYTKTRLKSGKTYFFTVKAYKTYKGKTYISSYVTKKVKIQ